MLADLVRVTTPDGFALSGAYFAPARQDRSLPVDALLYFHGDSGNFYNPLYLKMGEYMAERGLAFLTGNRRGHDHVSNGAPGGPLGGYAHESVNDSRVDFAAWLDLLRERGHRRIALGGHSGGAVRSVYAQSTEKFDNVVTVIPVSPGEYNHKGVIDLHGEDFLGPYRESERNLAEGRPDVLLRPGVPWGSTWSARTWVDCFNVDNRYSVLARAPNIGCPTLFIFGSEECVGGSQELPVCGAACRGLQDAGHPNTRVTVIEGANHGYVDHETELMDTIFSWLKTV